jgi:hypothetical protein
MKIVLRRVSEKVLVRDGSFWGVGMFKLAVGLGIEGTHLAVVEIH